MLPGDRLICAFVEPQNAGLQFKSWLLHVTIVPWFRLPDSSENVAAGLERALKTVQAFEAVGGEAALFGPRKNRRATLIKLPTPFTRAEQQVRSYFHKKRAWLVDETTKKPHRFRPHITAQGEQMLRPGDTFRCDKLYIIEQKGDYKEIVAEVRLGD